MQPFCQLGSVTVTTQIWKFGHETSRVFLVSTISQQVETDFHLEMQWTGTQTERSILAETWHIQSPQTTEMTGCIDAPGPNWKATRWGVSNEPEDEERMS